MTVSTELSHEEYVGNGVTTDFDFRFRIFESKHLIVVVADNDGNETTLKNGTDYTIVGAGSYHGGKVVLNKPLAKDWKILLERDLPVVQETDLRNQGKFFAEVHEDAFDYLTMLIQKALGTFSLSLRKPTYLSNYYDAKGNRIANLAPPKLGTDVANKDYVDNSIKDIDSKTLRVKDKPINALPNTEQRANKILAFDDNGQPITVLPESGSASDVLIELGKPTGASMIGVQPNGNLQQMLNFVTPEQFGAIGDGVYHPLSERFDSLSEAQETYPHVTSLDQSIDWAACQAADNYARGVSEVRCIRPANYHFGSSDYLELGISSRWTGLASTNRDSASVVMTRTAPSVKPDFGQDCVVRVMDSTKASSPDEFVRGVVFDGFLLSRGEPRRSANKGKGTICFHANYGIGMQLGIVAFGAEYGVFGYSFWGSGGWLKIDGCHKGFFADSTLITPEHPVASQGSVNTTFHFDVRIDVCVFGLVLNRVKYSSFSGYIEGMYVNDSLMPIYDHQNETAIAVTAIRCDSVDITQLGIEAWEGVFVYNNSSTLGVNLSWTPDYKLKNTTGKHSAYHSISTLMGVSDPYVLPETNNSYFYCVNGGLTTLRNMTGDMSNTFDFGNTFLVTTDVNSRFMMENCAIYFGSSRLIHPENGNWKNITFINDRFFKDYFVPSGYTYIGNGMCKSKDWLIKSINGGDGRVVVSSPDGWEIVDVTASVIASSTDSAKNYGNLCIHTTSSTQIIFQTGVGVSGYSISYKPTLKIVK
ncbi:TPA: hypothetical protein OUB95_001204 [Proteus mirabilis]|nr:hypothetical protein [Proteus mirabilis]